MTEKVAVVGSRDGADVEHAKRFLAALYERQPETIIVSGGNRSTPRSVDLVAEQTWLSFGGRVISFRPRKLSSAPNGDQTWGVMRFELGGSQPRAWLLDQEPTWANFESAAMYRDILIADEAERVVAFYKRGRSWGTALTVEIAREAYDEPVHEFEAS